MTEKTSTTNRSICISGGVIGAPTLLSSSTTSQSSPSNSMAMSTSSLPVATANNGNNGSNLSSSVQQSNINSTTIDNDSDGGCNQHILHIATGGNNSIIDRNSIMNSSVISTASNDSLTVLKGKHGQHGHVTAHAAGVSWNAFYVNPNAARGVFCCKSSSFVTMDVRRRSVAAV